MQRGCLRPGLSTHCEDGSNCCCTLGRWKGISKAAHPALEMKINNSPGSQMQASRAPGSWLLGRFLPGRSGGRCVGHERAGRGSEHRWPHPAPGSGWGESQSESQPATQPAGPAQLCRRDAARSPSPSLRTEQTDTQPHRQTRCRTPVLMGAGVSFQPARVCPLGPTVRRDAAGCAFCVPSREATSGQALSQAVVTTVSGWCGG